MNHSLKIRLVVIITITLLVCFIIAAIPLIMIVSSNFEKQKSSNMMTLAKSIALHVEEDMLSGDANHISNLVEAFRVVSEFDIIKVLRTDGSEAFRDLTVLNKVTRKLGKPLYERESRERNQVIPENNPWLKKANNTGRVVTFNDPDSGRVTLLYPVANRPACFRCHDSSEANRGFIMVSTLNDKGRDIIFSFEITLIAGIGLIMLIAGSILWYALHLSVTGPLEKMASDVRNRKKHGLVTAPFQENRNDEIGDLSRAFNDQASRLLASYEKTKNTETFLQTILSGMGEGITVLDKELHILMANRPVLKMMKMEEDELLGRLCYEVIHHRDRPCDDCAVIRTFQTGKIAYAGHSGQAKDGSHTHVKLSSYPIYGKDGQVEYVIEKVTNIGPRLRMEERVRQSEKMAAVGALGSGLAHEIGNPLTSISNVAQIIERKTNDEWTRQHVRLLKDNIDRIKKIVGDFLEFARPKLAMRQSADAASALTTAARLARFDKRLHGTRLAVSIPEGLQPVRITSEELQQIALNLIFNAADATRGKEGGLIEINAKENGDFVEIRVRDNGPGISEAQKARIFEPFYTTKQPGDGVGLGLFVTFSIVKRYGGEIEVESKPEASAEFIVRLRKS